MEQDAVRLNKFISDTGLCSRREADRQDAPLRGVQSVQREEGLDALRRGDRAAVAEDVHDRRADADALRAREDPVRELEEVAVEPDLALPALRAVLRQEVLHQLARVDEGLRAATSLSHGTSVGVFGDQKPLVTCGLAPVFTSS